MAHTKDAMSQGLCPECEIGPFTRNHYFTGKLLVEADFTDEQRYHREKMRHHNQRLHGWGVVCGLKVKQHENPACRDRFICIEPGTAIDCCGHEIVVREQEYFDFTQVDKIKELYKKKEIDTSPHTLQVCISYKECPTEEIPVLYDECGCDDTSCAPNRILESYDIDVLVVPPKTPDDFDTPRLVWENTINIAHAFRVALHDATQSLYEMVGNTVYKVSTDNYAIESPSLTLPASGVELAVSNHGTRLYVVTEPSDGSTTLQLFIYDATNLGNPPINNKPINLDGSVKDGKVYLAVAPTPDNRLFALVPQTGKVLVWAIDIDTSANPAASTPVDLQGTDLASIAISSDGKYVYTTDAANHTIHILDVARMKATPSPITVSPSASPSTLAIVSSTGTDLLAVADQNNKQLYLVDPNLTSPASFGPVPLPYNPLDLVASPAGHWVYVLEQDGTKTSHVRAVNVHQVLMAPAGHPVQPTEAIKVGNDSQRLVRSESGRRLYVPYQGDPNQANDGGVTILTVTEQACDDLFWRHLDGCPHCDIANCVVLATIENYKIDFSIEDQVEPPAKPEEDAKSKISRIDNRKGRCLLPSMQALVEVLECVMENGVGGTGVQGPPGPKGADGQQGRQGDPGPPGPGFEKGLIGINALSWIHASRNGEEHLNNIFLSIGNYEYGLVIGFTGFVDISEIVNQLEDQRVFEVLVDINEKVNKLNKRRCLCSLRGKVIAVDYQDNNSHLVVQAQKTDPKCARGVAFVYDKNSFLKLGITEFFVRLRGDFVLDTQEKAIDAEFVRHSFPTGNRLARVNGDSLGIQGGLFESWFTLGEYDQPTHLINVNVADRDALLSIEGIGPGTADNILRVRAEKPFADLQDLRSRVRISESNWARMSDKITVEG